MSFDNDREGDRRRRSAPSRGASGGDSGRPARKRGTSPELGQALRAAYQRTIDEAVPPEMLDLLGKLG